MWLFQSVSIRKIETLVIFSGVLIAPVRQGCFTAAAYMQQHVVHHWLMLQDKFSVFMCYFAFIVSVARLFTEIALYGALHYVHINVLVQQR